MKALFVIPARGGSKGVPKKNIRIIEGKPLIQRAIDFSRKFTEEPNICVSTDSDEIIAAVEKHGLKVPFKRPDELATDNAGTYEVLQHAVNFYESEGLYYDILVLLQPTTPFRKESDLQNMLNNWSENLDLLVSVKESHDSPYFNLFEEDHEGYLKKSKESEVNRRQDSPKVYAFNGSIYIYNINSLKSKSIKEFKKIKKYIMDDPIYSIDIDTEFDWLIAETVINKRLHEDNKDNS
ncbi:N-acylneuraminate cytidylyltransferase [Tenacibaculum skagerrakense]|uniref:N-acylneuraminate cytidylyltransferase n=1 Tax=Tenacibaculum skagerrakense TaxID=186571 RepID=A0A4V2SLD1_9FLAO|nr:acylneuraminate cytidylyltransferase family protein [Tenacibaculum skagerrakense]TCP22916.1 N-acylneuraminate cytidylyltransferase [Tenacibaculum skagerrakense]